MVELLLALLTTMTGLERTVDADLTAIAQRRAVEIQSEFSHTGWDPSTAEIIAYNSDPDPVTRLALQWQGSPAHWAILVDPQYALWGCAISQAGDATWGVCLFRGAGVTTEPAPPAPAPSIGTELVPTSQPIVVLPNTAQENPMLPFIQKEPAAVAAAIVAVLNVLQLAGVVSLNGDTVSAINIALVAVLGLFVRQNVYSPDTTQKIADRAAATGNTNIGEPPSGQSTPEGPG